MFLVVVLDIYSDLDYNLVFMVDIYLRVWLIVWFFYFGSESIIEWKLLIVIGSILILCFGFF